MRKISKHSFLAFLVLLFSAGAGLSSPRLAPMYLQANTGRLVGTVVGPDGGVINGAKVSVTDNQTGREYTATSSDDGTFSIGQLQFGQYTVKITASGFKTYTATSLKIDAGTEYSLRATLEVGNVSETVTVTAGSDIINATNAQLSNTVSTKQIQDLPLNGRNPLNLIGLQAGTSQNGATDTSINGQRTSFTNITRDGINIQDNFIRANDTDFVPDRPNIDNVAEFTITTQNGGAQTGYGASQIQFVTPRGSNGFHGYAQLTNRNSEFAANDFFSNASNNKRPFLNRNQFGGTISGPFIKDKLFFFGSVEIFKLRQSTLVTDTVLEPQARNGIFTYVDNSGTTRSVNILNLGGVPADPLIQSRILANTPASGNTSNRGDGLNTTGFAFNRLANQNREAITYRTDYQINSNQSFNVVFSYNHEFLLRPDVDNGGFTTTPFGNQDANTYFISAAHHWILSNTFTNEIRGGFQLSDPKFDRTNQPSDFFIGVPLITSPESTFQKQGRNTGIFDIQDNATKALGRHTLFFGGEVQVFRVNPYGPPAFANSTIPTLNLATNTNTPVLTASQFTGGISSNQLGTANSLLALIGGIIGSGSQAFNVTSQTSGYVGGALPSHNLRFQDYAGYFQDQFRVTPEFTINAGLRYDLYTPVVEPNGLLLEPVFKNSNAAVASLLDPNGSYNFVGTNNGGHRMSKTDSNNFAPSIGVAYMPNFKNKFLSKILPGEGKSVIRGGFSISYVNDEYFRSGDNALSGNAGLATTVSKTNQNARFSAPLTFSAPPFSVPITYAQNNAIAGGFGTVFGVDPNLQVPSVKQWNVGIQREVGWNTAVEFRYVGSQSTNLIRGFDFNQVDIFNNGFAADFNRARANLLLTGHASCTNPGCQPLTVFPHLVAGGLLTNGTVIGQLIGGTPADLAIIYYANGLAGSVPFVANPSTGVADLLTNSAKYYYNSFQAEVRHRFSSGLLFQANYTFSKDLTNAGGTGQTRFDPFLDINNPGLDYTRADFDQTHVFNANFIYELPFGNGKRFLNRSGWVDRLVGGFELTSIFRFSTGNPVTITDARGTLNRAGRSGRQTPDTSLSDGQVQNLIGIFTGPTGQLYWINPSAIDPKTGRAADGFGTTFPGEVFFNVSPGTTGNMPRAVFNGPRFFDWDASIIKRIRIKENKLLELRVEAFNAINNVNFLVGLTQDVNSSSFGKITSDSSPRTVQLVGKFQF